MRQFWAIYKKADFFPTAPPTFGPKSPKWQNHCKHLMVFHLDAKKYKKLLNGSKDIVIWKIEWSDWSRAFAHKFREWEFSQIWNWCRKRANHNVLHLRPFLAKTNDSIFHKSPKPLFLGLFGPFFPEIFSEKSGSVTFEYLWTPNFMQKNRKN